MQIELKNINEKIKMPDGKTFTGEVVAIMDRIYKTFSSASPEYKKPLLDSFLMDACIEVIDDNIRLYLQNSTGKKIYMFGVLLDIDTGYILLGQEKTNYYIPAFNLYKYFNDLYGYFNKKEFLYTLERVKLGEMTPSDFLDGRQVTIKLPEGSVIRRAIRKANGDRGAVNYSHTKAFPLSTEQNINNSVLSFMRIFGSMGFHLLGGGTLRKFKSFIWKSGFSDEVRDGICNAFSGSTARLVKEVVRQMSGAKTPIDTIAYRLSSGAQLSYTYDTSVTAIKQEVIEAEMITDILGDTYVQDIIKQGRIDSVLKARISVKQAKALTSLINYSKAMQKAAGDTTGDLASRAEAKAELDGIATIIRKFINIASKS